MSHCSVCEYADLVKGGMSPKEAQDYMKKKDIIPTPKIKKHDKNI